MLVIALNVDVAGDFLERGKHLQAIRMDFDEPRAEGEVGVDLLIAIERLIQYLQRSLDHGAASVVIDVARVNDALARTFLGTSAVAQHAFAIQRHLRGWTGAHTGPIILE